MYDCLMVLLDESDLLTKQEALHTLALQLAHQEAARRGLSSVGNSKAYADYVFPRCDVLEGKLHRLIGIGPA
jgi:hypothetical protein